MSEVPTKSWEFFLQARQVCGLPALNKIFKVESRQIYRWSCNPRFSSDSQFNPLDRLRFLFEEMSAQGQEDAVVAAILQLSTPVKEKMFGKAVPDRDDLGSSCLDVLSKISLVTEVARGGEHPNVVLKHAKDAHRELDEFVEHYTREYNEGNPPSFGRDSEEEDE